MYNTTDFFKFAACVLTTATLIACDSANVTQERTVSLLDDSDFANCTPIEIDLSGTRLLGHASATESTSTVDVLIPDGNYQIILHYEDEYHSRANQPDQPFEIWYLEGKNAAGELALITNHTDDLPADKISGYTDVGSYPLEGIVKVSGRHAYVGPEYDSIVSEYNSIEPTMAEFIPDPDVCFDPAEAEPQELI